MSVSKTQITQMRARITDEIFNAFGFRRHGVLRRLFGAAFNRSTNRFARIFAEADEVTRREGLPAGCRVVVEQLAVRVKTAGVEKVPAEGPLIVAANHPGAHDSVAIGACLPRPDLKIIVLETGFYRTLTHIRPRLIFATNDPTGRMLTLRNAIQHLQAGGALLQFGSGTIDPDPQVEAGAVAALDNWSPSLEIFLRKVPQARLVFAAVSGVLLPKFAQHPLARMRRGGLERRRLAEFLQVLNRLVRTRLDEIETALTFSEAVSSLELTDEATRGRMMALILARMRDHLAVHGRHWGIDSLNAEPLQ